MSKVICDLCGTSYADTADQCPICGTAKSEATRPAGGEEDAAGYAYVKGGRFSQSNVRKHNSGRGELSRKADKPARPAASEEASAIVPSRPRRSQEPESPATAPSRPGRRQEPKAPVDEQPSNIGLIVIVIVLVLAIISVSAYIAISIIKLSENRDAANSTGTSTTMPSGSSVSNQILCESLTVDYTTHTFNTRGEAIQVTVDIQPADTTEQLKWEYDNKVVNVEQKGSYWQITPVGPGETKVLIRCGSCAHTITITSNVTNEPDPTDPPVTQPSTPEVVLELNRTDFTLNGYGASWNLTWGEEYVGPADPSQITWSSTNESVATVVNGKVTAVGNGSCHIVAEWEGQRVTCIVYCKNVNPEDAPANTDYVLSDADGDATVKVGSSFVLTLRNKSTGTKVEGVKYSVSEEGYVSVTENGMITGLQATGGKIIYVIITYNNVQYKCIVRVTN